MEMAINICGAEQMLKQVHPKILLMSGTSLF
jgi:hypothetical protein